MSYSDLKLFALSSNKELAEKVASAMGIQLGKSTVRQFSDGEIQVNMSLFCSQLAHQLTIT